MSIFKCKMCGGTIEFEQGASVGVCDSCGTKQTLPRLDDDKKANLYDRANHFRRNNDFDKAMSIYEQILNEDSTDAEAYWSLVLCRYGIEYVEDPATHKRIPTVNRAQFTSVYMDEDYKSALQYADGYQKTIYEAEAKTIDDIQKGILEISSKEEPFDVFICYKETDAGGRRTQDSVLANDLYHQLTQEGFKVFFSRITLEDKLGTAYEPYIFAALNSAKVMVVLGTKPEYFNAVWVKNEWSRYLALIKNGAKKMLIPAYRDMDPYDLPEEFSHLQAQDMSKLGFMQDLIRGIKKIISVDEPKPAVKETVVVNSAGADTSPLLERVFLFLEDGRWQDANIYCEKVLDIDPKNAEAYLGKLMAELNVRSRNKLADCELPFDDRENFGKVIRFGDERMESEIRGYIAHINERNETARLSGLYNSAVGAMTAAKTEDEFKAAASKFDNIAGFKDSESLAEQCRENAETARKNAIYYNAVSLMKRSESVQSAVEEFKKIPDWKDSAAQIENCKLKIEKERIAEKKRKKEMIKIAKIGTPIVCACIAFLIVLTTVIIPKQKLHKAMSLIDSGDYEAACALLEKVENNAAIASNKYDRAIEFIDSGDYEVAYLLLDGLAYKDSSEKLQSIKPYYHQFLLSKASVGDNMFFGSYEQDGDTSNGKEDIEWLVLAKENGKLLVISKYALDCQPYNSSYTDTTWEKCSLRAWMNDDFLNNAFSVEEQSKIVTTNVSADKNPEYSTYPGFATTDKVFLLSITEAEKYFSSVSARQCKPTKYAIANGASVNYNNGNCWWWLRSPGSPQDCAAYVTRDGYVDHSGDRVNYDSDCVRPALWIDLDS